MSFTTFELVAVLADGKFHSGDELGQHFGVTRSAIWKAVQKLSAIGLELHSVRGRGYRLSEAITLLDKNCFLNNLSNKNKTRLSELEVLGCVDSTNSHTLRRIQSGTLNLSLGQSYLCVAEMQTAGKGRRGRQWVSPFGHNLYLSMVQVYEGGASELEGLSLVVGLALVGALHASGFSGLGLKWPNDVLWQGKKLAGILIEINGDFAGSCQVVIGLGLNLKQNETAMQEVSQPWTSLEALGFEQTQRNLLLGRILDYQFDALERFRSAGFASFISDWRLHDVTAGKKLELSTAMGSVSGVGEGVDTTGALLLRTEQGVRKFYGGEISLRAIPDY
ncbi:MAG: bifunctional biotin--[acetyl-CoA-carboxylase] ligase/biotin operon repressor BirA [Pseudomonadota bacterium]